MRLEELKLIYDQDAPPRRGALAFCRQGRLAIITGSVWIKGEQVWRGVPVGLSASVNEVHKSWQSKRPWVVGYVNIEDLT
jgi:hypothetical protein